MFDLSQSPRTDPPKLNARRRPAAISPARADGFEAMDAVQQQIGAAIPAGIVTADHSPAVTVAARGLEILRMLAWGLAMVVNRQKRLK